MGSTVSLVAVSVLGAVTAIMAFGLFWADPAPGRPRVCGDAPTRQPARRGAGAIVRLPRTPAVAVAAQVIALHGSGETGDAFRWHTGYAFDRLADANGFVVVYPDGYEKHWDDCRKAAAFSARTRRIDDVAFVRALIDHVHTAVGIDRRRVFATGYSNGGQMTYRLALEMPDEIRAIAAMSASLPTAENLDCQPSTKPIAATSIHRWTRPRISPGSPACP